VVPCYIAGRVDGLAGVYAGGRRSGCSTHVAIVGIGIGMN